MRWGGIVMVGLPSEDCVIIVVEFLKPVWTIYRDDPRSLAGLHDFMRHSLNS